MTQQQATFSQQDMQSLRQKLDNLAKSDLTAGERKALASIIVGAARDAKSGNDVSGFEWVDTGMIEVGNNPWYGDEIYAWVQNGFATGLYADVSAYGVIQETFRG